MIKVFAAALAMAAGLVAFSAAHAEGGCGWGYHRGPHGYCRPNSVAPRGAVVVVPGAVIYAPLGRACPVGYHLGPHGRRCWPN